MKNANGWHKFNAKNYDDLSGDSWVVEYEVLVEDGKVLRGVRSGRAVYPYCWVERLNCWNEACRRLSLSALRARMARGTAVLR